MVLMMMLTLIIVMSVSAADNRLVWCGVAMGVVISILLIVLDEAIATQPMLKVVHWFYTVSQKTSKL